jgi:hypothetical protein
MPNKSVSKTMTKTMLSCLRTFLMHSGNGVLQSGPVGPSVSQGHRTVHHYRRERCAGRFLRLCTAFTEL